MDSRFSEIVTTEAQLYEVIEPPSAVVVRKTIASLDDHCRAFIAASPFLLIASSDAEGRVDISPKGDPPGFVQVLDDKTLAIPDRPGNRRADTFRNVMQNPKVGLFFMVPGKQETLRVSGRAVIARDLWLRETMVCQGKTPDFALVVAVEEVFFHCAKCIMRSHLWKQGDWPEINKLPSLAQAMVDHGKLELSVEEMQSDIDWAYRETLY